MEVMDDKIETQEVNVFNRDEVLARIGGLLQIENDVEREEKTSDFIQERLKLLTTATMPKEFSLISAPRKGFLHPESRIRRNGMMDPFKVDDHEVYRLLLETFKEFKDNQNWQGKSLREIAPYAVLRLIGNYFGNHYATTSTENNNREFYVDRMNADSEDIHLNELKGKGFAVCAEKAVVAQNLLSFLGYESELVASTKCRLESPEKDDQGGHMYTVITSGENHLIFDPANPILIKKEDGGIQSVHPAFYSLDQEKYRALMSGGQVEVTHNDETWDGQKTVLGPDQRRIYGGPS